MVVNIKDLMGEVATMAAAQIIEIMKSMTVAGEIRGQAQTLQSAGLTITNIHHLIKRLMEAWEKALTITNPILIAEHSKSNHTRQMDTEAGTTSLRSLRNFLSRTGFRHLNTASTNKGINETREMMVKLIKTPKEQKMEFKVTRLNKSRVKVDLCLIKKKLKKLA